jgi:pimeloyl-ACP methyl ester carboxylesterase
VHSADTRQRAVERRTSSVELLWDLVFVFAVTQVTTLLSRHLRDAVRPVPPKPFDGLPAAAQDPQTLGQLLPALEDPEVRKLPAAVGLLVKHPLDPAISDAYALPCIRDSAVLRDTAKAMAGASTVVVRDAGEALIRSWKRPALFVWPREDPVFAIEHAHRYAGALVDARVIELEDCYSFIPRTSRPRLP